MTPLKILTRHRSACYTAVNEVILINKKTSRTQITREQRREALLRRKARQAEQLRFERNLILRKRAEGLLIGSLMLMPITSFFMFADRACGGALSVLMLLILLLHLVILCRFKELWKKHFIPILCIYTCSGAITAFFCTIQSAVFSAHSAAIWVLALFFALLAVWLPITLKGSENRFKGFIASILIAASLFSLSFFIADRINISFDRKKPQPLTAAVLNAEKIWSESSYTYWIKAAFPLSDGSRTTRRFCVLRTDDYNQLSSQSEITLLRHEGALGCEWYEIALPK